MIRVLIADDHPVIRSGIAATLAEEEDIEVVGEAGDSPGALRLCELLRPDVLLFDLRMPGLPCREVIGHLARVCPRTQILVLTAYRDETLLGALLQGEVQGVILKEESPEIIVAAIRAVRSGACWISPVVQALLQAPPPAWKQRLALTTREQALLDLIAQGKDNAAIAEELYLSPQTVRNYASRLYGKLGVCSRAEAILWVQGQISVP